MTGTISLKAPNRERAVKYSSMKEGKNHKIMLNHNHLVILSTKTIFLVLRFYMASNR